MSAVAVQSHLTPEVVDRIERSLLGNASWKAAADYAGITDRTLRTYRERAERYETVRKDASAGDDHPDKPYWEATQRWMAARAEGEQELVKLQFDAARKGNVQAGQWLLKVGWPDRYNERIVITGADGGPVEISVEERTEALLARAAEHRARCDKHTKTDA